MSIAIDHRPNSLDEIIGNSGTVRGIKALFEKRSDKLPHAFLLTGQSGCVDCDTEFLSPEGWIKISEYDGQKVMQFNPIDNSAEFIKPLEYIKRKSNILYHIKTKYGIDQCLSKDHRVLYYLPEKGTKYYVKKFDEIIIQHEQSKSGFGGRFLTTFTPKINSSLPLTNEELRVQVMFIADGTISEKRKKGCVNLKKQRKIERAEKLLNNAKISFDKYEMGNGYTRFYFIPPYRDKIFTKKYFKCSLEQLKIISDEVFYWDAEYGKLKFHTNIKESKDFIQYSLASCGLRSSVYQEKRGGYAVCATKRKFVGMTSNPDKKIKINEYKTKDGFEYCFQVPSSYLILRRNGNIFVTGNCGKTTIGRIIAKMLGAMESDFREIDTADFRGIDTIREIRKQVRLRPQDPKSTCRVWLIDECHQISKDGQSALLKGLEDAPEHVFFILCTTDPQKLLPTIQGRCTPFSVAPLNEGEMNILLRKVCRAEKINLPNEARELIYQQSFGQPRNALKLLEKVAGLDSDEMADVIFEEAAKQNAAIDLARALIQNAKWKKIADILNGLKNEEEESLRRMILSYCNTILLKEDNYQAFIVMDEFAEPFYNTGKPGLTLACYKAVHASE